MAVIMSSEEKRISYNWDNLIREIKRIQRDYARKSKTKHVSAPLVIKKKEYAENYKIIERGLMRWECIRRNKRFIALYEKDHEMLNLGNKIQLAPNVSRDFIIGLKRDG